MHFIYRTYNILRISHSHVQAILMISLSPIDWPKNKYIQKKYIDLTICLLTSCSSLVYYRLDIFSSVVVAI